MSQADLIRSAGVSDFTIRRLMRGEAGNYRADRLAKVATALRWETDAIDRILRGDEPPTIDQSANDVSGRLARLEAQVAEVLALLRRLDTPRGEGPTT